jgi:3-oxoacyl-[acyl-carrier-protein] synthase-3
MVEEVLVDLGIPPQRAMNSIAQHGNTSGATVPMALAEAIEQGRLVAGQRVLLTSVGAGYTFGAAICRM